MRKMLAKYLWLWLLSTLMTAAYSSHAIVAWVTLEEVPATRMIYLMMFHVGLSMFIAWQWWKSELNNKQKED